MQTGSGAKNPPWARSNVNSNMTGMNPQIMDPSSMMSQQGMMPFQQTQVFNPGMMQPQGGMGMPMTGQMPMNQMAQGQMYPGNVVAYPTPRAMNPGMYQNNQNNTSQNNTEQRVFTGTVTKTHNDFGFVDHDVFYQTSVCAKGVIPKVHDRVLVEATYNPNMPFKWNATRVQVLPKTGPNQNKNPPKSNTYNAVPPPVGGVNKKSMPPRRDDRPMRRDDRFSQKRSRSRSRSRSMNRRDSRNRRDSPPRKRPVIHQPSPVKYIVRVPRMPLDIQKVDAPGLSQRYSNLYIPSDFFNAQVKWGETFPPQMPFSLNNSCSYHVMSKEVENPRANNAVLEPPDADYRFSAKVMLISMPTLESIYQKCGLTKIDEKDKRKIPLHPTRLIKFLVGQKGKGGENFAIGGPWSPSMDGENPETDPSVLVKTAIRTCKALTGVDLSACTQWYRMVEFYYWREGSGGKSRLETVVFFLPDVWSAQASRVDWTTIQEHYKASCEAALKKTEAAMAASSDAAEQPAAEPSPAATTDAEPQAAADKSQIESSEANDSTITIDENDDDEGKAEPTHYSKLDLKSLKVDKLRQELRARNVSCKGLRAQLVSRLSKLLKIEEEKEGKSDDVMEVEDEEQDKDNSSEAKEDKDDKADDKDKDDKVEIVDDSKEDRDKKKEDEKKEKELEEMKRKLEKEKQSIKSRYELPSQPHIIVHPNTTAKNGKFCCYIATLSVLLDYRITDNKEHSFELFVFAELFNEMLMRDFGFYIYKTLYTLPEKFEEIKEKEKNKDEKKEDKTEKEAEKKDGEKKDGEKKDGEKKDVDKKESEKKDEKEKDEKKKDDKRDEKRESRKRDKESHSDDERSSSPKRRSRGVDLPPDPYLLLSLVYFDTSRCSYINRKDLQNLFMSLGLQLSRSQIRSILDKVCMKDNFTYKPLVQAIKDLATQATEAIQDMPLDGVEPKEVTELPAQISELESIIAAGNRDLLPVFNRPRGDSKKSSGDTTDVSDTGMVVYKSRVVDVGALVEATARSSALRARLEDELEALKRTVKSLRAANNNSTQAERMAQEKLQAITERLNAANKRVSSLMASSKIFHSALKSIQTKVDAVVNIKYEDDDCVEVTNGPTKTEKVAKKEEKDGDTKEVIELSSDASIKEGAAEPKEEKCDTDMDIEK